ncbi:hypothetical protein JXA47_13035 [Candidatus Sumerlaeota bacterium]|nr:hypothetical protein [Candidatus Sumerlaeota bacterium]
MRILCITAIMMMICSLSFAQTVLEDWEDWATWEKPGGVFQDPNYSGSTSGLDLASAWASEETIIAPGGSTMSGRLDLTWTAVSNGFVRATCYPTRPVFDGSTTGYLTCWIYAGANTGQLTYSWVPRDGQYEQSEIRSVNWSGWAHKGIDLNTETFTGWVNGDGTLVLSATNDYEAFFVYQNEQGAVTSTLYFDDFVADTSLPVELSVFASE